MEATKKLPTRRCGSVISLPLRDFEFSDSVVSETSERQQKEEKTSKSAGKGRKEALLAAMSLCDCCIRSLPRLRPSLILIPSFRFFGRERKKKTDCSLIRN